MRNFSLTEQEYHHLIEIVDAGLNYDPLVDEDIKSLAIKLGLDDSTLKWMDYMLDKDGGIK